MAEHPSPHDVPGVEVATGSLGHGLSLGLGMALTGRIQKKPFRVFAVLSDGECNEGEVWEAAMFAAARKLAPRLQGKRVGIIFCGANMDTSVLRRILNREL